MAQTAMQLHISLMKKELHHMYQNDIRFGLLLKLIREANELLTLEQLDIMDAYHQGTMQKYSDKYKSSLEYYNEKYEKEAEG